MGYLEVFKMPNPVNIMGRTSSITNAFVNGIIPCILPNDEEIKNVLEILGMDMDTIKCAYCGDRYTEWDHFRPLVKDKRPTGYISEINNLVPACGKCNQSKGNKDWKKWILSNATLSPKTRGVQNLELIVKRLEEFENQISPTKLDFESIVGKECWDTHWKNCLNLHKQMKESQELSNKIRELLKQSLKHDNNSSFVPESVCIKKIL
jgi:hypothetical protein